MRAIERFTVKCMLRKMSSIPQQKLDLRKSKIVKEIGRPQSLSSVHSFASKVKFSLGIVSSTANIYNVE